MTRLEVTAAAIAVASTVLALATVRAGGPETTVWTHGRWFDGTQFRELTVYSTASRLTLKPPAAIDHTVDLGGRFVTGAFAEAHNHNIPGIDARASVRTYLEQGIFYVMIQTNVPRAPAELAGLIDTPGSIDVAFANGAFTAPGGHPTALVRRQIAGGGMTAADLDGGFLLPVASQADIARAWTNSVVPQRPDFIKLVLVYAEDRVAGLPTPADSDRYGLDPALAGIIVRKAHAAGLRVSAHVESAFDFEVAVKAGADIIAHLPGFWPDERRIASKGFDLYKISEPAARNAGRRGVKVITTIGESLRLVETDPKWSARRGALLDVYRHNIGLLSKHGVRLAIGSDQFRGTSVQEAIDIEKAGLMDRAELLRALSVDGAATVFPKRGPCGLMEGARADFLVLDVDPLQDFTAITRIGMRVKSGVALPPPAR